jgi:2-succinyl-5-enolpyruvyl-6-hydroxy-3-cyclohexene-1-carboxylate synthase
MLDALAHLVAERPRGLVVCGWGAGARPSTVLRFADAAGWPVLADPLSGLRVPGTISTYDPLLRDPGFAGAAVPDVILRVGGPLTNKVATQWMHPDVGQAIVDPDGTWLDPHHAASARMEADPELVLATLADAIDVVADDAWVSSWRDADGAARATIDALVDGWDEPFEGRVARDVYAAVPAGGRLVVASSMPVRDVESFAAARDGLVVHANRGVNGIDGFVSTALGVAAAQPDGPTVALLGDLCLLHDSNGLLGAVDRGVDVTLVVVDNGGGGIFSFLPQAELPEHFETLFGTPQAVDVAALAGVHGIPVAEVTRAADLVPAVRAGIDDGGVRMVRVRTDRATNVTRHREVWRAVADAVPR